MLKAIEEIGNCVDLSCFYFLKKWHLRLAIVKKAKRVKHSGQTKAFHLTNQKDAREFILVLM